MLLVSLIASKAGQVLAGLAVQGCRFVDYVLAYLALQLVNDLVLLQPLACILVREAGDISDRDGIDETL